MGRGAIVRTVANKVAKKEPLKSVIAGINDVKSERYTYDEVKMELVYDIIENYEQEIIRQLLENGRVILGNFITLEVRDYPARTTYNFELKTNVSYPSAKMVRCKASRNLKEIIQGRKSIDDYECDEQE